MANYFWVSGAGTWDNATKTNWATVSGGAGGFGPPTSADTANFDANSGSGTVDVKATAVSAQTTLNNANINLSLSGSPTLSTASTILTAGQITLNANTLTCGIFSSNNTNARTIDFGTGKIVVTNNANTVLVMQTITGLTVAKTPVFEFSYSGATGTRTIAYGSTAGGTEANSATIKVTAGTDIATIVGTIKNLDYTGFSGTVGNGARTVYGNLTISTGATVAAGANATTFAATSGTQQITTNGKTLDFPLIFNGIGGTFAFQDALTQGSTRAFTIANGTVQLKAGVTSITGVLATSGTNQKVLQSTSAGSQATLSQASGNFNAQYLTVKDIAATGGAKFNALNNCITQGNNSGWYFAPQLGRPLPSFAF